MQTVFLFLLMLRFSRFTVGENYETKTVNVGEAVTLSCPRSVSWLSANLFWFRLVSGALPEFLGGTFSFDDGEVVKTLHWTTKQEPQTFVLILHKTQLNDTGLYFCFKQAQIEATLLKGVFLRVKEPGPDITTVIRDISSDPARPWDSRTLQCSVLYDPDNKPCPGGHRVFGFRAGYDESRPSFIYTHGNRSDGCEKSSEDSSLQKCTYSFSETVSSSDEETFYCAVAACGEVLFGNGTKLKAEGNSTCITDIALFVVSAALAICLIVIALLIYIIKTKSSCKTDDDLHKNAAKARVEQGSQQEGDRSLVYAAPTFSKKKPGKEERRNKKRPEEETVYSGVRSAVTHQQAV